MITFLLKGSDDWASAWEPAKYFKSSKIKTNDFLRDYF